MEVRKKQKQDVTIFYLGGEIDLYKAPELKSSLMNEINENNLTKVIINLRDVEYIDSGGIGVLIQVFTRLKNIGRIRFCEIQDTVADIIRTTSLDNIFPIDEDEHTSLGKITAD